MVTKAALGTSGLPMTANMRRFPVPWMFFLFEEKAATEEWWPVFAGSPLHSHWPASLECMRFLHALPAQAQRHSSMSQGHRPEEGPAHSQKRAWKMGWSWLYCSRVCLRNDSASFLSTLHLPYSLRWWGTAAHPLDLLCLLFLQHGDRHLGLLQAPTQHSESTAAGGSLQREALPFLAPSLPTRKKPKGHEF